jgi:MFS family permease
MNKLVLGLLLGGALGAIDGYSAKFSAPEVEPQLMGIIIGSTAKGLLVGALVGWYALRVQSLAKGLVVGLVVSAFFAFVIAAMPNAEGHHYWIEIIVPGSIVGLIVGYATQKFGRPAVATSRRTP